MNKLLHKSWLILLLLACIAQADSVPADSVLATSYDDDYWVARVQYQSVFNQKPIAVTSVYKRIDPVAGHWEEYASIHVRASHAVAFQGGLALLDDAGKWKLIRSKQVAIDGPALPVGYRLIALAADGEKLFGLGEPATLATTNPSTLPSTLPAHSAIFQMQNNAWKNLCDTPEYEIGKPISFDVVQGKIFIAYPKGQKVQIDQFTGNQWQPFGNVDSTNRFKLVNNSPYPLLGLQDSAGKWSINRIAAANSNIPLQGEATSDLTMVGPTLRLVSVDNKGDLKQISYYDYGNGQAHGPDVIGQVPVPQQVTDVWRQLGLMLALTVVTLMTLKPKSQQLPEAIARSGIQIAPVSRRIAAGIVDIMPFLLAIYMTMPKQETSGYFMTEADFVRIAGPTFIGFFVYVLHTTVGEMLFSRSIGKWIFGLIVVSTDGQPASKGSLFVRNLLRFVDVGLCVPWILIALTPMQQRLGDLAGKTIVIVEKIDPKPSNDSV